MPHALPLNVVHISKVPKFLAESHRVIIHAMQLIDPFDAAHLLIIPLQLSRVTSYFDVYTPSIAKYENQEIFKIHLTAEEPSWDPSTEEYSHRETSMCDHQGQISIPATAARGPQCNYLTLIGL